MDSKENHSHGLFATSTSAIGDDDPTSLRIARSGSSGTSMEAYMQSVLQQQHHQKGLIMNTISPQLPPPVAMSLRARETASMSLKHIFDQQMSNGASSREQECKSTTQGQQMGGFQGMRNQSMPDLRKRVPELDLSFTKAQDSNFASPHTGFGSPISTPTHSSQDLVSQASLPMNIQLMQHNRMPQAVVSGRLMTPSSRQPTAQMTVFYSGSVNVFDDVPADKARAIMLLAGDSWSANFRSPMVSAGGPPSVGTEVMAKERALTPLKAAASQQEAPPSATKINVNNGGTARSVPSSVSAGPAVLSIASPPPSPAPVSLADNVSTPQAASPARRPHAGIELPHARKASLARFLEKRKDRVQVQQGGDGGEKGEKGEGDGRESASCSGKPHDHPSTTTPSSKKACIRSRSRSPSPARSTSNTSKRDNNGTNTIIMRVEEESSRAQKGILNEHCFFH